MNLERLEYFSTLAAYLNYSRAAEQLFISQPSLSKQIATLEKELGVQLFRRSRHTVSLTREGQECLAIVRPLLDDYQRLKDWAKEKQAASPTRSVCIGYYGMLLRDIVLAVVNGLMARQPHIDISLKNDSPAFVILALQNGIIDLAILRDSYCRSLRDMNMEKICSIRQVLLVPEHHRLAGRTQVRLEELAEENFIDLYQKDSPQGHNDMLLLCRKYGLEPHITHHCDEPNSYMMMIQSGRGIGISHAYRDSAVTGIRSVELCCRREDLVSDVMAVWKKETQEENDRFFSHTVREICRLISRS